MKPRLPIRSSIGPALPRLHPAPPLPSPPAEVSAPPGTGPLIHGQRRCRSPPLRAPGPAERCTGLRSYRCPTQAGSSRGTEPRSPTPDTARRGPDLPRPPLAQGALPRRSCPSHHPPRQTAGPRLANRGPAASQRRRLPRFQPSSPVSLSPRITAAAPSPQQLDTGTDSRPPTLFKGTCPALPRPPSQSRPETASGHANPSPPPFSAPPNRSPPLQSAPARLPGPAASRGPGGKGGKRPTVLADSG